MKLEKLFLLIFFVLFLWSSVGTLGDYRIVHGFPFAYLASDTFQHQTRTEAIKVQGSYLFEPFWIVAGWTDNAGFYPPLMYHVGVLLSYASGLETWDVAYLFVFLFVALAMLAAYYTIKQFNQQVALISLPFMALVYSQYTQIGFTWGFWPNLVAQSFMVFSIWQLTNIDYKWSFVSLGILFAAVFLTHSSEAIILAMFLVVYFAVKLLLRQFSFAELKKVFFAGILAGIISLYSIYIFKFTWMAQQVYTFGTVMKEWPGIHFLTYTDLGIYAVFVAVGVVFGILLLRKQFNAFILFSLFILLVSYGNYWGMGARAFNLRFFWPIYLSVFFGLGLLMPLQLLAKKWNYKLSFALSCILMLLVFNVGGISAKLPIMKVSRFTSPGLMDAYHWEMFEWIRANTAINSTIYFLYGDFYDQNAMLRNTQRRHIKVFTNQYVDALKNQTILRYYPSKLHGDDHGVGYAHSITPFKWGYYEIDLGENYTRRNWDICGVDYYVVDRASQTPVLAQYNILIANELLKNSWIKPVFYNDMIVILKNEKPGEVCLPDETKIA